jgi:hypothetical protein
VTIYPPAGIVASAEQDYRAMCANVERAVEAAQVLVSAWSEVEAFAEVYYELSRRDPYVAKAMGAAAIIQLARASGSAG